MSYWATCSNSTIRFQNDIAQMVPPIINELRTL